jgi:ATP-dependent helicase Lhr and Lhr-like helicase
MSEVTQLTAPELAPSIGHAGIDGFHPAVAEWFRRRFPDGPTEAQEQGWPHIATGADTLIAAPTGSGPGSCTSRR